MRLFFFTSFLRCGRGGSIRREYFIIDIDNVTFLKRIAALGFTFKCSVLINNRDAAPLGQRFECFKLCRIKACKITDTFAVQFYRSV